MLNLNNPQSKHIFAAARLEDAVLEYAKRIVAAQPSERLALLALCEQSIDAMRSLNSERFGNSAFTASAIDEFRDAILSLSSSDSPDLHTIFPALAKLRSDEGFGTDWI